MLSQSGSMCPSWPLSKFRPRHGAAAASLAGGIQAEAQLSYNGASSAAADGNTATDRWARWNKAGRLVGWLASWLLGVIAAVNESVCELGNSNLDIFVPTILK